jgi:hypothetical protein
MTGIARIALLSLVAIAALAASGCGNKTDTAIVGETEGIYVSVDGLTYQVQISRILNPASPEDSAYLKGLPEDETEPAEDEVWFGVFMRVENETDEPLTAAEEFTIRDTTDAVFEPIEIDPELNVFVYEPREVPGGGRLLPELNSPASDNTIQGALILFKLKTESLGNRPVELEIASRSGGDNAIIDLDI